MIEKRFPILNQQSCLPHERKKMPRSIAWSLVEPFRVQVYENHEQTLERLVERGGLAPEELYAAVHGLRLRAIRSINEQIAIDWLYTFSGEPRE
jgi:hypothetical protein